MPLTNKLTAGERIEFIQTVGIVSLFKLCRWNIHLGWTAWNWSFTKLSENPLCELTSVKMWIHDPFWPQNININIYGYGTVILSLSVSNMYISRISEHFQLKWKMNVMHLLEADLSTEPFLLFGYSWWSLIFTVNHSDDSFFAVLHVSMVTAFMFFPLWMNHVGERLLHVENIWFYTIHSILYVSQRMVYVNVWLNELAPTVRELLYDVLLTGACFSGGGIFFACGLACKVRWLEEKDHRVASIQCHVIVLALWLQLADVNIVHVVHLVSCKMGYILFFYFILMSKENKLNEQTKTVLYWQGRSESGKATQRNTERAGLQLACMELQHVVVDMCIYIFVVVVVAGFDSWASVFQL